MKPQNVTHIIILIVATGLLPQAQAVIPPPDGGYPGGNTAEGQNALLSLTAGGFNTAVGFLALRSDTTGSFNTAIGAGTLLANTGASNTATGAGALLSNTSGTDNTADGAFALFLNTATGNTAIGSRALVNNTTGGTLANIQGVDVGPNVAVGWQALESNTIASGNTAMGYQALRSFTTGPSGLEQIGLCTAVGFQALANATGNGFANSAFGYKALHNDTNGSANTAIGLQALLNNTTGASNVAIGNNALSNVNGDNNTALGMNAGSAVTTGSNIICIGANVLGANADNSCYIGNIFGSTASGGIGVFVNSSGRLGTSTSSQRFKERIRPMDEASEALYALEPVKFRYKKEIDPAGASQFGLVAEDVEKINPDLVVRDKEGKPYSVRYDQVNAMLLNEFLKEHKKVQQLEASLAEQRKDFSAAIAELKKEIQRTALWRSANAELKSDAARQHATISDLKKQLDVVLPRLEEHHSKIQTVSDQLEMTETESQIASNNP